MEAIALCGGAFPCLRGGRIATHQPFKYFLLPSSYCHRLPGMVSLYGYELVGKLPLDSRNFPFSPFLLFKTYGINI